MTKIIHRFINHNLNPATETLVIGTFNPETKDNKANFFYSRPRNFLWTIIPTIFNETSLKGNTLEEKLKFIEKYKIDFIDLISEVDVNEVTNYNDGYLDSNVTVWRDVISEISKLKNLKRVCFTRKSFGDIPRMKMKIDEIKNYCEVINITFQFLITPARFYSQSKQSDWNMFFNK